jgi:hypothetical protein
MSVFRQHQFVSLRPVAATPASVAIDADGLPGRMLRDAIAAGRRGAEPALTTRAVLTGWRWLGGCCVAERQALHADLRQAIARGQTTPRAWLPIAVAETNPALLRAAVAGYIGSAPRSVAEREQALEDVIEWFRRDLTLDRVAVFEALLALREPAVNARLALLRGRLTAAERDRVRNGFAAATDAATREFFAEWDDDPPVAQAHPD